MKKFIPIVLIIFLFSNKSFSQQIDPLYKNMQQLKWVDSIYNKMSFDEKLGQLFMPYVPSNNTKETRKKIKHLIQDLHIGNVFFLKGHPSDEQALNNYMQKISKYPILSAIDAEWGLSMRLDSTPKFPWNMTLGAIQNDSIIYKIGRRIGQNLKNAGYQMNFSPDADINTNPNNPIIGNRSFGEDMENVARKSYMMMSGLQDEDILTTAKHFPGHGDTNQDSHKTLPRIDFDYDRIQKVELYPFKKLINQGLTGVMIAHLKIPALDFTGRPSTLSYNIVSNILKKQLAYRGLIITDAMAMKGVADYMESGMVDLEAFLAGNDVLLGTIEIDKALIAFKKAYKSGKITDQRLALSVRKILAAKYWAKLHRYQTKTNKDFYPNLQDSLLNQEAFENAITLIKNENNILPIKNVAQKIAFVPLGDDSSGIFYKYLNKYTKVDKVHIDNALSVSKKLKNYDLVIVGFHKSSVNPWKSFKFSPNEIAILKKISKEKTTILDIFSSPYALIDVMDKISPKAVVISYQNDYYPQEISPQMIFGALAFKGKLPVGINISYPVHTGIVTEKISRLSYGFPEQVGMSSQKLKRVDSLMQFMLDTLAAPGAVVLAARNGKVIFEKTYGYQTYQKKRRVQATDLYDLASVTKVLGTTTLIMKAYDEKMFKLNNTLGELMPDLLKNSNKDSISVKEALSHYAKIKSWIPFYLNTIDPKTKKPLRKFYRHQKSKEFNIEVAKNLYLKNSYLNVIFDTIAKVPQYEKLKYVYSGLPFYLFKKYIEDQKKIGMDRLLDSLFYKPLGATTITYKPLKKFRASRIAPTEKDDYFRHQILRGYVHDMGAAMLNGVSGNAGLFGDANDLAKMMQMYLNNGTYGKHLYISDSTFQTFNHRYFARDSVRRGLGWDKPQFKGKPGPTFEEISSKSFGHQGFTGTMVWADPEEQIVYIFLSNRTYPTMKNRLLYELNFRSEVHRRIYEAIKNPKHNYHHQSSLNPYEFWKTKNKN